MRLALLLTATAIAATAAPPSVRVTQDSLELPAGCSPREVATLVTRFVAAYNAGDAQALEGLIARQGDDPPAFQWLTLDRGGVYLRSGAIPYLTALREGGLRLELEEIDVGTSWVRGGVGVSYRLRRTQGDPAEFVSGKGEIHCASRTIYVWSMASGTASPVCPGDFGADVLACSRGGRRPNAQEVASELELGETRLQLPRACAPGAAQARILRTLRAFNLRDGKATAANFARKSALHLYTADSPRETRGRSAIAARVNSRAGAGDGLTLVALRPPTGTGGRPERAIYGLTLRVNETTEGGVKVVFDCRSGLITHWVGPAMRAPS